jgi:signal transduction histidine kinase/ActR/RegA family two-component response regulator
MTNRFESSRYVVAILATLGGATARAALTSVFAFEYPFMTFYPAVMVSAWFGGLWPGVLCTALSAAIVDYFWLTPFRSMAISSVGDGVALAIFAGIGIVISALNDSLLRGRARDRRMREEALSSARELAILKDRLATELADMTRLHELSARLLKEEELGAALHHVLDAAVRLLNADNGHVQLLEEGGKLRRIAAHVGFSQDFLDRFELIPGGFSLSSTAIELGERVIVEDVFAHPQFTSIAPRCATHGFISGQSTPLVNSSGVVVGALSTHFLRPHSPSERELRMLDLHVRLAERLIERSRLLEREQAARASAEAANRTKDEFLAIVSHELRAPLNAVLGWSEMLRNDVLDKHRRERALEVIYTNAKRQRQLIDELLDVGRIMSGKVRLERAPVDLASVVRTGIEMVQPLADAKHIRLTVDAEQLPGSFYGDVARLQQILGNLFSNAIKFTPDGGAVHTDVSRKNGVVEIAVSDSGIGIPREFLPHVFEPFRQADGSTTRRHGGLGLGLSIVRHLVEAHAGSILVESAGEGRGSTFTIRLPVVAVYPSIVDNPATSPLERHPGSLVSMLDGITTLVVDDDLDSREVIVASLENAGATTLAASSVQEALAVLRRHSVDVLLADIAMPNEDGYSLIRQVRDLESSNAWPITAVALTAYAREDDRRLAIEAGFQMHLAKPIDSHSLVDAVARLHASMVQSVGRPRTSH